MKTSILLLIVALVAIPCQATQLTFQQGDGSAFSNTDAARLASFDPNANFGGDVLLNTDGAEASATQMFLIRFSDMFGGANGQVDLGSTINSASLTFRSNGNTSPSTHNIYQVFTNWNENTVTFNNFNTVPGVDYASTPAGSFVPNSLISAIDVTSAVQAWSNGATNLGLILFNSTGDGYQVHSDDASTQSNRPLLTVDFEEVVAVPEPGTALLCLLGFLIGGVSYRKRS